MKQKQTKQLRFPDMPSSAVNESVIAEGLKMESVPRKSYFSIMKRCRQKPEFMISVFNRLSSEIQKKLYLDWRHSMSLWALPGESEFEEGVEVGTAAGTEIFAEPPERRIIRNKHPQMNMIVAGSTGSGKSVALQNYMIELSKHGATTWLFTNKLTDAFRISQVIKPAPIIFQLMHCYHKLLPTFLINPFMPPKSVEMNYWFGIIANLLGVVSGYVTGGIKHMRVGFDDFRRKLRPGRDFTFGEVFDSFSSKKPSSRSGEMEKHLRCVEALWDLMNFIGRDNAYSIFRGHSLEELNSHNVIFVVPNIPSPAKTFLTGLLYLYMAELRDKNQDVPKNALHFAIEEAHELFPPDAGKQEHSALAECSRYGRFVNLCLSFTSHTTNLDSLMLSNLHCQVFKQMTNPRDFDYIHRVCGLSREQVTDYHTGFGIEHGIVKMSGHKAYKAFIPNVELPEVE